MHKNKYKSKRFALDFDEWMALAKDNPNKFEEKRRQRIESFLDSIPTERQHRLKGLQWKIDQKRKLSSTPMASCIEISNMMWDSMIRLRDYHYELVDLVTGRPESVIKKEPVSATILKFESRSH